MKHEMIEFDALFLCGHVVRRKELKKSPEDVEHRKQWLKGKLCIDCDKKLMQERRG